MVYIPPLGNAQKEVLRLMADNGGEWQYNSPWVFRSKAHTIRILESLVKRNMVVVMERQRPNTKGVFDGYAVYVTSTRIWEIVNG